VGHFDIYIYGFQAAKNVCASPRHFFLRFLNASKCFSDVSRCTVSLTTEIINVIQIMAGVLSVLGIATGDQAKPNEEIYEEGRPT